MNERLEILAMSQQGAFGVGDAARVGVGSDEITRLVRRGEVVRVRRGAYILSSVYAVAPVHEQYRLRVMAVLRSRRGEHRASHHSALALHGLVRYGTSDALIELEGRRVTRRRVRAGLATNPWSDESSWGSGAFACVSPARACVQLAVTAGFTAAVCAMDSALNAGKCTVEELIQAAATLPPSHRAAAVRAIAAADEHCESAGETRTRVVLVDAGFTVASQVEIRSGTALVGRVDLLVDGCVIVEFDGLVKYDGMDGRRNLAAEKAREERLNRLGYEVVRVVWSDLRDPAALIRRVLAARALTRERQAAMRRLGA